MNKVTTYQESRHTYTLFRYTLCPPHIELLKQSTLKTMLQCSAGYIYLETCLPAFVVLSFLFSF